jgi:hypothetical protein
MIFPSPSPGLEPGLLKVCSHPIFGMLIEIIEIELRVRFF